MGILAIHPCVTTERTVVTKANAITVINGMVLLATPHTLLGVERVFFSDTVVNRGMDLLDPCVGEGRGNVEGGINVTLKASKGISSGEAGRASI